MKSLKSLSLFALVATLGVAGCQPTSSSSSSSSSSSNSSSTSLPTLTEKTAASDETVYATLDASGAVSTIQVVNRLQDIEPGLYKDYGDYLHVMNLSSSAPLLTTEEYLGVPVYAASRNFYYQGELASTTPLPFLLDITYFLEDVEILPAALAGEAGTIKMMIDVTSNDDAPAYFREAMMMQLQLPISLTHTSVVSAPKATSVVVGRTQTLAYMILPGQSTQYELTLESDSFELENVIASLSPFDLNAMLDMDFEAMIEGLTSLGDALAQSASGGADLASGLETLVTNLGLLSAGLTEATSGLGAFATQFGTLVDGLEDLVTNLATIVGGLQAIVSQNEAVSGGYAQMQGGLNELLDALTMGLDPLDPRVEAAADSKAGLEEFRLSLLGYLSGVSDLTTGLVGWQAGLNQVVTSLPEAEAGVNQLHEAVAGIATGLSALQTGATAFPEAMTALASGLTTMANGLSSIQEVLEDYPLQGSDEPARSFVSSLNPTPRSTQFVFQIAEITIRS